MSGTIVWLRQDLRLEDNPALLQAAKSGEAVIPVYVWAPEDEGDWPPGGASRWWLHHSLAALDEALQAGGSRLVLRAGPAAEVLPELAREAKAERVVWNRRYEPAAVETAARVARALARDGQGTTGEQLDGATLLFEPEAVANRAGRPFQVFTPFWSACRALPEPPPPAPAPRQLRAPARWPRSAPLAAFELLPRVDWAGGLRDTWHPGEAGARARLRAFTAARAAAYARTRDFPASEGFSRLSPHLHHGELSPRRVWHAAGDSHGADVFRKELGWREFAYHLLHHFPHTPAEPLHPQLRNLRWAKAPAHLRAWQRGRTGYPLVDAGMRQLWHTGYLPNRVRMVVASLLVKHLLLRWQDGARWFWDTLVDADLANNTLNWQWVAGTGADAAPFFRIFNPEAQARRFDPDGAYVRAHVPELTDGSGSEYPAPIVDHAQARRRALEAYADARRP